MRRMVFGVMIVALWVIVLPNVVSAQAFIDIVGERLDSIQPQCFFFADTPVVSPDGNWVAYADIGSIYLMPVQGGDTITLFDVQSDTNASADDDLLINGLHTRGCYYGLDFSPDNSKLIAGFKIFDPAKGSTWTIDGSTRTSSNGIPSIVIIDIFTGEITYVTDGQEPKWSPDGRYIYYRYFDSDYYLDPIDAEHMHDMTIYDLLTGDITFLDPINATNSTIEHITFGPDGMYLYFIIEKILSINGPKEFTIGRKLIKGGEIEILSKPYYTTSLVDLSITSDGEWAIVNDLLQDILAVNLNTGEVFNALTGKLQGESRFAAFEEPLIVRNFANPLFSTDENKLIYVTATGQWTPLYGPNVDLEVPPEERALDGTYIMDFDPANYNVPNEDVISAVDELPQQFMTLGVFPNPFNPTTTLQFTLPEAGYAELEVFSFTGQKIRTLAAGQYGAGVHSIGWDGRDEQGNPVSSGIYLSRLTSRDNVVTSRMTLVK